MSVLCLGFFGTGDLLRNGLPVSRLETLGSKAGVLGCWAVGVLGFRFGGRCCVAHVCAQVQA